MEKKKKHLSISGGRRSVSRLAELAWEKSCQVCLMFLMTYRLLICLPLLVFILSFMSDSDWDYWGYVIACSVSYCLHFILNLLVFFFFTTRSPLNDPAMWLIWTLIFCMLVLCSFWILSPHFCTCSWVFLVKFFTLSSSLSLFLELSTYSKPCTDQLNSHLDSNRCMNTHSDRAQVRNNSCAMNFCEDHAISALYLIEKYREAIHGEIIHGTIENVGSQSTLIQNL